MRLLRLRYLCPIRLPQRAMAHPNYKEPALYLWSTAMTLHFLSFIFPWSGPFLLYTNPHFTNTGVGMAHVDMEDQTRGFRFPILPSRPVCVLAKVLFFSALFMPLEDGLSLVICSLLLPVGVPFWPIALHHFALVCLLELCGQKSRRVKGDSAIDVYHQ